jgi:hypothetical protein
VEPIYSYIGKTFVIFVLVCAVLSIGFTIIGLVPILLFINLLCGLSILSVSFASSRQAKTKGFLNLGTL